MPHFTTFDRFASKAIVHPQFQEGSKAIVHPQFQEAAKAIVHPQFQPEASKAIIHPDFRPEASSQDVGSWTLQDNTFHGSKTAQVGWDVGPVGYDPGPIGAGSGQFTTGGGGDSLNSWRDVRDHNHGKFADALTNPDHAFGLDVGPVNQGADVWTNGSATSIKNTGPMDLQSDALVQQGNDFAGLINPGSMRPAEFFSHNPEWFAPGSAVDSWTEKTFGNGDGEILGGISQGNVFAPINALRNGYDEMNPSADY